MAGDCNGHHAKRCGQCFSLLYWTGYEGRIRVPYGSLVDEPNLKPTAHMFVGSKAPWYEILDDLPQHESWDERHYGRNHLLFWVKPAPAEQDKEPES